MIECYIKYYYDVEVAFAENEPIWQEKSKQNQTYEWELMTNE